jgi:hypothetical protein
MNPISLAGFVSTSILADQPSSPGIAVNVSEASEPASRCSFPGPAFFDQPLLGPGSSRFRPVGSEVAAGHVVSKSRFPPDRNARPQQSETDL